MKFIFPKNYTFKNKLLGFIDYTTAIFNLVFSTITFSILHLLITSLILKISLFIIICFPIALFSILGFNGENFLYVFSYILKYYINQKLFFYNKNRH